MIGRVRGIKSQAVISSKELRYVCEWMLERLLGKDEAKKVKLNVYIKKLRGNTLGVLRNRVDASSFAMSLHRNLSYKDMIEIIGHELRHIHQIWNGYCSLTDNKKYQQFWKNKDIEVGDEYYNLPWEIDSRKWQKKLATAYRRHLKRTGKVF